MENNQTALSSKQTKKNLWFFPLGTLGRDMMYNLFTNYILLYVLFTHRLTAAQLMAITVIMTTLSWETLSNEHVLDGENSSRGCL